MLPNYEYPVTPIMHFDPGRGPPVPNINVPQIDPQLANEIGRRIANEAGLQAGKNPIRMVAYNLISANNWYNQDFEEVFMLTIGHILISQARTGAPVNSLYENSIDSVLTLYASGLLFKYEELRNVISAPLYQAFAQNAGILQDLKQEMQRVHVHGASMQPVQQAGYGIQPIPNQPGWGIDMATGNMVPLPAMQPAYGHQPAHAYPGTPVQGHYQHGNGFAHRSAHGQFGGTVRLTPVSMAQRPNETLTRDFGPMQEKPAFEHRQPEPTRQAPQSHSTSTMGKPGFRDFGGDDTRHSALSQGQHFKASPRMFEQHEPEIFTTRDLSKNGGRSHQQGDTVKADQHEPTGRVVGPSDRDQEFLANITQGDGVDVTTLPGKIEVNVLEHAILKTRMQLISDSNGPILRQYVSDFIAIMSGINPTSYLDKWFSKATMKEIVKDLDDALNSIKLLADDGSHVTTLIREVDLILTARINDFLINCLNLPRLITIDSVVEDFNDLPRFLQDEFGHGARDELEQYADSLAEMLKRPEEPNELHIDEVSSDLTSLLASTVALTMFPVDHVSLNLPVNTVPASKLREYCFLDPEKHAVVIGAIQSLFDPSHIENPFDTMIEKVIIITRDNARYRVYKLAGLEQYHIKLI